MHAIRLLLSLHDWKPRSESGLWMYIYWKTKDATKELDKWSFIALQLALPKTKHLSECNSQILSWTSKPHHVLFLLYPLSLSSLPTLSQKAFDSQAPSLSSGFSLSSVIKALILLMAIEIITSFQSIQTKNTHVKTDM